MAKTTKETKAVITEVVAKLKKSIEILWNMLDNEKQYVVI